MRRVDHDRIRTFGDVIDLSPPCHRPYRSARNLPYFLNVLPVCCFTLAAYPGNAVGHVLANAGHGEAQEQLGLDLAQVKLSREQSVA